MIDQETRARAVVLVGLGIQTLRQIAEELQIGESTLSQWKADPEFREHVKTFRKRLYEEVIEGGVGDMKMRVIAKSDRWRRALRVMEDRAADPEMAGIPGGSTGLIVKRDRTIHTGKDEYERIIEHEFDTGLWNALGTIEQESAIEMGQWKQKVEHSVDPETQQAAIVLTKVYTREQIEAARQKLLKMAQPPA